MSTFKANIIQMMQLSREAVPHMKRGAAIINTSSVVAYKVTQRSIPSSSNTHSETVTGSFRTVGLFSY
jgi:NAD(P)-dependent dehydrogenase (short-subunit alcohol dehydrogenase family)